MWRQFTVPLSWVADAIGNMSWNLFLDDIRDPSYVDDGREYVLARSYLAAQQLVVVMGMPTHVSFDHDLGWDYLDPDPQTGLILDLGKVEKSGYDLAKWIIECDLDGTLRLPDDFTFYVHSSNPVGKANIEGLLSAYLAQRS
jgi:hypothetical protein